MATWVLLLIVVGGFYSLIVPALPSVWAFVAGVVYGLLASSTIVTGVIACVKDPIDPNVRRFHQVGHVKGPRRLALPRSFYLPTTSNDLAGFKLFPSPRDVES